MTVTSNPDRTVYAGEDVTLTCDITLDPAVDSEVAVTASWTVPSGLGLSAGVMDRLQTNPLLYRSTLTLSFLMTSDSGDYTCTASVDPYPPSPFVLTGSGSSHTSIKVG